jgi:hypothetical protein
LLCAHLLCVQQGAGLLGVLRFQFRLRRRPVASTQLP